MPPILAPIRSVDNAPSGELLTMNLTAAVPPPKPKSLRDYVEDYLRAAIMDGQYQPGARLVEREICELLNVSRPPVREALRKLEAEKLIATAPHRGPVVAAVTAQEAREIYELRAVLEAHATAQFARLATDAQVEQLRLAIHKLHFDARLNDRRLLLAAVKEVYDVILGGCGNALIRETLLGLFSRINLLRATSLSQPNRLPESLAEIDRMFELIQSRQADAAGEAARLHILNAQKVALAVLPVEPA